mgnify:FL=1|tara:strand:+ start:177 stop:551 length:375 start_codon:yes stop_codon:yes gene_type:complete
MNYLKTSNLNEIKKEIVDFQSKYIESNIISHLVIQSIDGYEINMEDVDGSAKELHSLIANLISNESKGKEISKGDLVYLITLPKLRLTGKQSLLIKGIDKIEDSSTKQNVEVKYKENLLNLIKI